MPPNTGQSLTAEYAAALVADVNFAFVVHGPSAPLAVLSMHTPTAVLPSMAKAGLDAMTVAAMMAAKVMKASRKMG